MTVLANSLTSIIRRLNRSGGRVHDAAVDSVSRATIGQPLGQAKWLRNKAAAYCVLVIRQCIVSTMRLSSHSHGLFHNNLPRHPRVWCTDIVIAARLREGDGFRLATGQVAGIPLVIWESRGVMI